MGCPELTMSSALSSLASDTTNTATPVLTSGMERKHLDIQLVGGGDAILRHPQCCANSFRSGAWQMSPTRAEMQPGWNLQCSIGWLEMGLRSRSLDSSPWRVLGFQAAPERVRPDSELWGAALCRNRWKARAQAMGWKLGANLEQKLALECLKSDT